MGRKKTDDRPRMREEFTPRFIPTENHEKELKTMNKHRRGCPYLLANTISNSKQPSDTSTTSPTANSKDSPTPSTN